jgi:replicative DNA helicase
MDHTKVKEIEAALVGAVLRDGKVFDQAREIVDSNSFGIHAYGFAWRAMERLADNKMSIDVFTVADELERMQKMDDFSSGGLAGTFLLSELRTHGEPRNIMTYAEKVQDYSIKRGLDGFFPMCEAWRINGRPGKEIVKDIYAEMAKIQFYSADDEFTVPMSLAVSEAYDETDAASRGENVGIKTGFIDIDKILGSLLPKNVYLVAGRPGQGKTGLLMTIAKNAAEQGKRVGIFSLEMSRSQVAQRLISQEAQVDLSKIIKGKMSVDEWTRYTEAVGVISKLPIVINDLSSIDITSLRGTARKIKESGGLDLILLDYIQLADSGKKKERRELEVSEVSRGLRYLARELEVPVLASSQLSREIEKRTDKRPVLSDLRESGSLEQDAYAVMFLYIPDVNQPSRAQVVIAKHRNGPVGSADLFFDGQYTQFKNATIKTYSIHQADA